MNVLPFKGRRGKTVLTAVLAAVFLSSPALSADRFEQVGTREVSIPGKAADLAVSTDGNWTFVLTADGDVGVYDNAGRLIQTIKVGGGYERLEYDGSGNRLVLAGSGQKLKIISLTMRFDIISGTSPYRGPQGAPVIITVFSDFQCPYCAGLVPLLGQVLEKYPGKVGLQFKNFPLRNHRMARPAAIAALAADRQGRFWDFHDKVFESFKNLNDDLLAQIARDIGLDMQRFERDRKDNEINNIINRDIQEASRIGVRGTPTVFVNGKLLGQRSLEAFSEAIETEIGTARRP